MKSRLPFLAMLWILSGIFIFGGIIIDGDGFNAGKIYGSGTEIAKEREIPVFDRIHNWFRESKGSKLSLFWLCQHNFQEKDLMFKIEFVMIKVLPIGVNIIGIMKGGK